MSKADRAEEDQASVRLVERSGQRAESAALAQGQPALETHGGYQRLLGFFAGAVVVVLTAAAIVHHLHRVEDVACSLPLLQL